MNLREVGKEVKWVVSDMPDGRICARLIDLCCCVVLVCFTHKDCQVKL